MTLKRRILVSTLALALLVGPGQIAAAQRPDGSLAARLQDAARRSGIPHYTRTLPNGGRRLCLNPSGSSQLRAVEGALGPRSNALEICHIGSRGANHNMAIFNRQMLHVQFLNGTGNWRLRSWGGGALRPSSSKLYSSVIQLSPSEAGRLQQLLQRGFAAQGPAHAAGQRWERGNLGNTYGRSFNCVSFFTEMPLGDRGEPLWRLLGLPHSYSGNPRGLMQALETRANDRVVGICVYGPTLPGFGGKPAQDQFGF